MLRTLLAVVILAGLLSPASAVEILSSTGTATFQSTQPTDTDVSNWTTGWGTGGTGWNYVGQVNGSSAVYLGNGWVITAAHVGVGNFTLAGNTYSLIAGSPATFTTQVNTDGVITTEPADFTMFQLTTAPSLPALSIATAAPLVGNSVVMTGYGGGHGETWGENTVTASTIPVQVNSYTTADFATSYGASNMAVVVGGDSGGGDFIFNTGANQWQLAGLNEAVGTSGPQLNTSYLIELSFYAGQINAMEATPEPATWALLVFSLVAVAGYQLIRCRRSPPAP